MKRIITFLFLLLITFSSVAQEMMSIGKRKLVKSSPMITASARTISTRTAVKGARIFSKVGGIAFIQVAVPADELRGKNISLVFDDDSQKSFINIEQNRYEISLSNWMLQPIVEFANDTTNVVVTIYGQGESPIRFHPSFVDKLLGMRLLQADLMLASTRLDTEDRCNLPANEQGLLIVADSEYVPDDLEERQVYSERFQGVLYSYMYANKESFDTYIYTDRDETIRFGIDDGKFNITGEPYYLFVKRDHSKVDTTEFINSSNRFFALQRLFQEEARRLRSVVNATGKNVIIPFASTNDNIVKQHINNENYISDKTKIDLLISNYYHIDSLKLNNYIKKTTYLDSVLTKEIDAVFKRNNYFNGIDNDISNVMSEVKSYHDVLGIYSHSVIKSFSDALYALYPESAAAKSLNTLMRDYRHDLLNDYSLWIRLDQIPYTVELSSLTDFFKENREAIYRMNPTVYDASVATAQWSAFFRYVKETNPSNWRSFVNKVRRLNYDAPAVWTPINISVIDDE